MCRAFLEASLTDVVSQMFGGSEEKLMQWKTAAADAVVSFVENGEVRDDSIFTATKKGRCLIGSEQQEKHEAAKRKKQVPKVPKAPAEKRSSSNSWSQPQRSKRKNTRQCQQAEQRMALTTDDEGPVTNVNGAMSLASMASTVAREVAAQVAAQVGEKLSHVGETQRCERSRGFEEVEAKVAADSLSNFELRLAERDRENERHLLLLRENISAQQQASEAIEASRAQSALSADRNLSMSMAMWERQAAASSRERILSQVISSSNGAVEILAPLFSAGAGAGTCANSRILLPSPVAPPALEAPQPQTTATMTATTPQPPDLQLLSDEAITEKKRKLKLVLDNMTSPRKAAQIKDAFDDCEAEEVRRITEAHHSDGPPATLAALFPRTPKYQRFSFREQVP